MDFQKDFSEKSQNCHLQRSFVSGMLVHANGGFLGITAPFTRAIWS
jgi:hypothetical protein